MLRFWEERFPEVAPIRRAGGRRYYRAADVALLAAIRDRLHAQGYTLRGVRALIDAGGVAALAATPAAAVDWRAEASAIRADLAAALAAFQSRPASV